MNTILKGNDFEDKAYSIIVDALNSGQLGIIPEQSRPLKKPKYYSHDRGEEIVFDIGIEVWPENAEQYTLLFLIECKDYQSSIPVGRITEFVGNIESVVGKKVRGIFITTSKLQKSALALAKAKGLMVIYVNEQTQANIIFHHARRRKNVLQDEPMQPVNDIVKLSQLASFLENRSDDDSNLKMALEAALAQGLYGQQPGAEVECLKRLSADIIENLAIEKINEFNPVIICRFDAVPLKEYLAFFCEKYKVTIICNEAIPKLNGKEINGYYDRQNREIHIDKEIVNSARFAFVVAHEIGHFFMHSNVQLNKQKYEGQQDSIYNRSTRKYILYQEKHWIEWQANQFAAAFLMPKSSLQANLLLFQNKMGISTNKGKMYVDHQPVNRSTYNYFLLLFMEYFQVTQLNLEYRMSDLGMLEFGRGARKHRQLLGFEKEAQTVGQIMNRLF